ncbi:MAG: NADH:ubiquinone reductase (Na(+)-transporting) subunit D [Prevotella sp.]|nr:NADH:ubiquinone reductase (Na(+)-transporting) subunit D [Prevotella sp.]MCI5570875.1 NADH:ubiquinone reductase (Na(+)-transporting) subunit D [Prevotella sp.]MCI6371222.1 NADH:ubiquinone reductase (Na(+)-transporting) subunit D [Prevotella sp.]MCI6403423.1 NADH:ubiquinone reductase (Na(+)-transporting) subunit D [Prevotella sp.]MCI6447419.1 NADH:ubiquinone reductase (Na(+)-transporting) subunit D [Prevotella sp.]
MDNKIKDVFKAPLNIMNPVLVQVLGICSALAVTSQLKPALVMGLAVTVITAFSNLIISLIRQTIPNRIRIVVQLVVVAALVTIVSQVLKAFVYDVSVELSVYVGLIITNCILMGRLEAFAMQNKPWPSFVDGISNGLGYGIILVVVGAFRELLGRGTLLGFQIIPESAYDFGYLNNGTMTMPAMALIMIGVVIWIHRAYFYKEDK